jgi:uncharacterized protein
MSKFKVGYLLLLIVSIYACAITNTHLDSHTKSEINNVKKSNVDFQEGDSESQFQLGVKYYLGQGVSRDLNEAVKWFELSANQGHTQAQFHLGWMHHASAIINLKKGGNRKLAIRDYRDAAKWFNLAAKQGNASAQFNLGMIYKEEEGFNHDFIQAYMWFDISRANGYKKGLEYLKAIEEQMTSNQVSKARELSRKWINTHKNWREK